MFPRSTAHPALPCHASTPERHIYPLGLANSVLSSPLLNLCLRDTRRSETEYSTAKREATHASADHDDAARGGEEAGRRGGGRSRRPLPRRGGGGEEGVPRAGGGPLQQPAQRGGVRQGRRRRGHRARRRAGLRGCHEDADPRRPGLRQDRRRLLQDLRLRLRHRFLIRRHRVGEGKADGRSNRDQEHRDRQASVAAAGEAPLQHARRGRHQGRGEGLRGKEGEDRRVGHRESLKQHIASKTSCAYTA